MAQIYLSSTYEDLKEFRKAAYEQLQQLGHNVVAMEDYVAADDRPLEKCLADVGGCDVYVGLIGFRYGYVPPGNNPESKSITELEYMAAEKHNKLRLIFIYTGDIKPRWADALTGEGDRGDLVQAFKDALQKRHMVSTFATADEISQRVAVAVQGVDKKLELAMLRRSARDILKLYCTKAIHDKLHDIYFKSCVLWADDSAQIDGPMLFDVAAYCAPRMVRIADAVADCDRYLNDLDRTAIERHRQKLEHSIALLHTTAGSTVDAKRIAAVGEFNERLTTWLSELDNVLKELADGLDGEKIRAAIRSLKEAYAADLEPAHALMDNANPLFQKCKVLINEHHNLQDVHDKFPRLFEWIRSDVGVLAAEWRRVKRRLISAREAWQQFDALPNGGENWEEDVRDDGEETWKLADTFISNIDDMLLPAAGTDTIPQVVPPLSKLQARVEKHFKVVDEALREGYRPVKVRVGEAIMQIQ